LTWPALLGAIEQSAQGLEGVVTKLNWIENDPNRHFFVDCVDEFLPIFRT
jgi:hypothetical protein